MKKYFILFAFLTAAISFAQKIENDSVTTFKKRVLDASEVDFLVSYYKQDGIHSPVSGGIGSENLTDIASDIIVTTPMNADDVLTIDVGISAYTSASSSNINPFNGSGASGGGGGDDDKAVTSPQGTPWLASSGASAQDVLMNASGSYSHSSNDRNFIWNANAALSNEFDYTSLGVGGGIAKLYNQKNTELSLKANIYLDQWRPIYPTELHEYAKYGNNFLVNGFFNGVTVYNQNGIHSTAYLPNAFKTFSSVGRNSYSLSFSFSQILNKKWQGSIFFDILQQQGLLSTPYHRIYFADKENYYIGQRQYIPIYESQSNVGVYRLSDDIERLPNTRFKFPIGIRMNYYITERFKLRTYYRYYADNWGIQSHTASIEIPIKLSDKYTIYPMYRYYEQNATKYFAPFETHLSTEKYYTSDYDLSKFSNNQYGFGISYVDIFTSAQFFNLGLKNIDFRYNHYVRSDGLIANIVTFGFKFIVQ